MGPQSNDFEDKEYFFIETLFIMYKQEDFSKNKKKSYIRCSKCQVLLSKTPS